MKSRSIVLLCLMALCSPLMAGRIMTINDNEIESSDDSIACLEKLYQTCEKKNYCKEADHCACLPHCCFSGDCRALCKDDVADCYPTIKNTCIDNGFRCGLIIACAYVPAHVSHHFVHAAQKRNQLEAKRME